MRRLASALLARSAAVRVVLVLEGCDVPPFRDHARSDSRARAPGAAAGAAGVLLALRPPGEEAPHRAVRHRARRGAARYRGAVVHGPHRLVRDPCPAGAIPRPNLA